jgi:DNA polymerase elongation subunit (family B)
VTLLEADTDGVYFAVPPHFTEADERRVVAEVGALLPRRVHLEFDGRYAAMLSHEPKNYALLPYQGRLQLRGVAFRSSRAEPFGERFLRRAIERLLTFDLEGVRAIYVDTVDELRHRRLATREVASRVRLTKTPEEYAASRAARRELSYEAVLASGQRWAVGSSVRVYRGVGGRACLLPVVDEDDEVAEDAAERDYDVDYYLRVLRDTFAARLITALTPEDHGALFEDPRQPSLFAASLKGRQPLLTPLLDPLALPTVETDPVDDTRDR